MKAYPTLKRWLSAGTTLTVFAGALAIVACTGKPVANTTDAEVKDDKPKDDKPKAEAKKGDWPLFGGTLQRNMVNTIEKNMPAQWSVIKGKEKNIKWVAELGSKAYGGPIVAGGKVFIGTNNENPRNERDKGKDRGIIMCFEEATGKFLWQAVHDKLPAGRVHDWPREGICSSPVVEGNRLWYVSNRCEVICADTEGFLDGKNDGVTDEQYKDKTDADIIWRLDMIEQLGVFPHNLATCSPLIVGDTLFVVSSNGVDEGHLNIPKPEAPSFLALDKKTGKVLWKNNLPSVKLVEALKKGGNSGDLYGQMSKKGEILMHGQWSNPVYAEPNGKPQIIFPGGDGWLYAFEPKTGELIWKFDCNPKAAVYKLGTEGTRNDFIATPVVYDNKAYIGVGQDPEHLGGVGHLWCIDITRKGDVSPVNDNFDPKAAVNKNSALVWHYGGEAPQGDQREYIFGRTMSTCAIHDGLLYVAELDGIVHCLDAKTGAKHWEHEMNAKTWSSPYWVDGKVYIGNDKGKVLIFAHGKAKKLLAEIDMKGKVRASPVAANGVFFVMTENKLYAIQAP
jgi:outer membrane protein assembly factor BamB